MLKRLHNRKIIGGKHLPEALCFKWIKDLTKKEQRQAKEEWKLCKQKTIVLTKRKPTHLHVYLNPRKIKEVKRLIKNETF